MRRLSPFSTELRSAAFAATASALVVTPAQAGAAAPPDEGSKSLPCRPTIACTADIVAPGSFELETGMLYRRLGNVGQWSLPFLAKLTMSKVLQLQVGSNGYTAFVDAVPPSQYFDDMSLGVKIHLLDQGKVAPSISISGSVGFPVTGSQASYVPGDDVFGIAYVTKDFGIVHADLNLGVTDWGIGSGPLAQEWIALALSVPLPPPFGAMIENYYFTDAAPFATRDGGFLFALSLTPRPWLVFDFGGDVGYFPSTRSYSSFVGMTIVPVLIWR